EQMRQPWIWLEPDLVARFEVVAFAEHRDDVVAAELGGDLQFGAGRLDHQHFGFGAVLGDDEVLRPDAIDDGMPVAAVRRRSQRLGAAGSGRRTPLAPANSSRPSAWIVPLRKFIAGEPMKPATNRFCGRS